MVTSSLPPSSKTQSSVCPCPVGCHPVSQTQSRVSVPGAGSLFVAHIKAMKAVGSGPHCVPLGPVKMFLFLCVAGGMEWALCAEGDRNETEQVNTPHFPGCPPWDCPPAAFCVVTWAGEGGRGLRRPHSRWCQYSAYLPSDLRYMCASWYRKRAFPFTSGFVGPVFTSPPAEHSSGTTSSFHIQVSAVFSGAIVPTDH